MTAETRKTVILAVLAGGLALVVLLLSLHFRKKAESVSPPPGPGKPVPAVVEGPAPSEVVKPPVAGGDAAKPAVKPVAAAPDAATPPPVADAGPEPSDTDEFAPAEVKRAADPVIIELGNYVARVGEEFEVAVEMAAPALSNVMLLMEFDPAIVECVADSAKRVGWTFRKGLEFYADNAKGRMILISAGPPGAKHTRAVDGQPVVSFRMKGKAAGQVALKFPAAGTEFVTATGTPSKDPQVRGGVISIR